MYLKCYLKYRFQIHVVWCLRCLGKTSMRTEVCLKGSHWACSLSLSCRVIQQVPKCVTFCLILTSARHSHVHTHTHRWSENVILAIKRQRSISSLALPKVLYTNGSALEFNDNCAADYIFRVRLCVTVIYQNRIIKNSASWSTLRSISVVKISTVN